MHDQIQVLMVDDEVLVLDSLERILSGEPDIDVVGRATSGEEALKLARNLRPDVVLMDLHLSLSRNMGPHPKMDGVEAIRRIRNMLNPPAVLAVTSFDSETYMRGALEAGAVGFLLKTDATDSLARAVRMTHARDAMISPAMTTRLISSYIAPHTDPVCEAARERVAVLADREVEVATLVGQGKTYGEIAQHLFISASTVKATIGRALNKVDAESGAQLAVLVAQARLDLV